jgi:hypothetical protein
MEGRPHSSLVCPNHLSLVLGKERGSYRPILLVAKAGIQAVDRFGGGKRAVDHGATMPQSLKRFRCQHNARAMPRNALHIVEVNCRPAYRDDRSVQVRALSRQTVWHCMARDRGQIGFEAATSARPDAIHANETLPRGGTQPLKRPRHRV